MTCCLQGSSPSRHFERREDPGNEVAFSLPFLTGFNASFSAKKTTEIDESAHVHLYKTAE